MRPLRLDFEVCWFRRMTGAGVRLSVSESDEGSRDLRAPPSLLTDKDERNENEVESCSDVSNIATPRAKLRRGRTSRNSRKTDLISLEKEMEERL